MSASIVQYQAASTNSVSPISVTLSATPTPGNTVCVIVDSDATVTGPTGYTNQATSVGNQGCYIWDKIAGASESPTITVTPAVGTTTVIMALEITGTTGMDAISSVVSNQGVNGQISEPINTLTATSGTSELVIACVLLHNFTSNVSVPSNPTWNNGFTAYATAGPTTSAGQNCEIFIATRSVPGSTVIGTTTASWTNGAKDTMGWQFAYKSISDTTPGLTAIPWLKFN